MVIHNNGASHHKYHNHRICINLHSGTAALVVSTPRHASPLGQSGKEPRVQRASFAVHIPANQNSSKPDDAEPWGTGCALDSEQAKRANDLVATLNANTVQGANHSAAAGNTCRLKLKPLAVDLLKKKEP